MESGRELLLSDEIIIRPSHESYWVEIQNDYVNYTYISKNNPLIIKLDDKTRITIRNTYSTITIHSILDKLYIKEIPVKKGQFQIKSANLPLILLL